jgi:hypothetical protein
VRVRYDWTIKSNDALLWEQSFSFDKGTTWDKNWIMESSRIE